MDTLIEYCARAVIQHLDGDMERFLRYKNMAMKIYRTEQCIFTIGEIIPLETKNRLYELVS